MNTEPPIARFANGERSPAAGLSLFGEETHAMNRLQATSLDSTLIVVGVGWSTLFVSTDGNGQNPLPVAGGMLFVAFITGVVSFILGWLVRTVPLAIVATMFITDLLFVLYFVCRVAFRQHVHDHAAEEAFLLPIVFAVVTAPTVVLSSIGFGRLASRVYQRWRAEPSDAPNERPA